MKNQITKNRVTAIMPNSKAHEIFSDMTAPRDSRRPLSPELVKKANAKGFLMIDGFGGLTQRAAARLVERMPGR